MSDSPLKIVLSAAEIQRWRNDAAEIDAQIERLQNKKSKILEKVGAAEVLAPSLFAERPEKSGDGPKVIKSRKGLLTWTVLIEEIVRNSVNGINQKELLAEMRRGAYKDRMLASESGYYGAMGKLLKRDVLKKRGDYLFTAAQYDAYMEDLAAGHVGDVAENLNYGSPAAGMVMDAVKRVHPNGAAMADVIKAVWDEFEAANMSPIPPKNSVYNTIARLVQQKHLDKRRGKLFLREPKKPKSKEPATPGDNVLPLLRVAK